MRLAVSRMIFTMPVAALGLALAGCATPPPASDQAALQDYQQTNDPLEPTNRFFYRVNNTLDKYALKPVATAYKNNVPDGVRRPIHNFLVNAATPVVFANNVLQAKPRMAGNSMMRFLINTTAGGAGLFDVATDWGYPANTTDFGVTLALWGVDAGPFLFLPVLGPSNPRDATGFAGDVALSPFTWATFGGDTAFQVSKGAAGVVDTRARLLDVTNNIDQTALDPYATYRSLYKQNRESQIETTSKGLPRTVPAWFSH